MKYVLTCKKDYRGGCPVEREDNTDGKYCHSSLDRLADVFSRDGVLHIDEKIVDMYNFMATNILLDAIYSNRVSNKTAEEILEGFVQAEEKRKKLRVDLKGFAF